MSHLNKQQFNELRDWYVAQNPTPETSRSLVEQLCEKWGLTPNQVRPMLQGGNRGDTPNVYVKYADAKTRTLSEEEKRMIETLIDSYMLEKVKPYIHKKFEELEAKLKS